ncbi:MAG: hypothetical protein ABIE42_10435 [Candidatus Eisenbacteria bacterium]
MRLGRAIIHGFTLAVITIGAVVVGFVVYKMVGLEDQIAVQVLVAGVVCVGAFAVWGFFAHSVTHGELSLGDLKELGVAYAAAFLWTPLLFIPLHFTTQGYMTSVGNVLSVWLFQLPFNLLALMVANGRLLQDAAGDSEDNAQ